MLLAAALALPPSLSFQRSHPSARICTGKLREDKRVRDLYELGDTLGAGAFSIVKLCTEKATGKHFACKVMALPKAGEQVGSNESSREDIMKEIDILCGLDHANIIYLKEYFIENNKVYLLTELLSGALSPAAGCRTLIVALPGGCNVILFCTVLAFNVISDCALDYQQAGPPPPTPLPGTRTQQPMAKEVGRGCGATGCVTRRRPLFRRRRAA